MVMANFFPGTYEYYLTSDRCLSGGATTGGDDYGADIDAAASSNDDGGGQGSGMCHKKRFALTDCAIFDHQVGCPCHHRLWLPLTGQDAPPPPPP